MKSSSLDREYHSSSEPLSPPAERHEPSGSSGHLGASSSAGHLGPGAGLSSTTTTSSALSSAGAGSTMSVVGSATAKARKDPDALGSSDEEDENDDDEEEVSSEEEEDEEVRTEPQLEPSSQTVIASSDLKNPLSASALLTSAVMEHVPGEVYTIVEEEEEAGSPTGADGVTSLRRRRQVAATTAAHSAASTSAPATSQGKCSIFQTWRVRNTHGLLQKRTRDHSHGHILQQCAS